jgi:hypothetical protein
MIAQELTNLNTAMKMIKAGLRPSLVHAATGLSKKRLRSMYRSEHGKAGVQGRVSEYACNRLKTRNQVIEATAFYQFYCVNGDSIFRVLDFEMVDEAYQTYMAVSPGPIDFTTAWYIARDLRENVLTPRRCQACRRTYLHDPRSDQMLRCPLCAE